MATADGGRNLATWTFLSPRQLVELDSAAAQGTAALAAQMGQSAVSLAFRLSATATVLALLDFGWQLWNYERSIRMTADEMREEQRLSEGNPQVKGARRERQRELAGIRRSD
ncbi:MAG: EscU/YscU/HrcU family type III secretion system export apparatus switch protein [Planctomycetota bacterium]|nr:EscU/YscU/HrcU family type III secretion system export apparatus switch protein [Planctomycetota bacterium]